MTSKKILLFLILLICTVSASAQVYKLNASYFVAAKDGRIDDEDKVDIDVTFDLDRDMLIIYSNETQVIDFELLRTYTDSDGYFVIEASATDTKWKPIHLRMLMRDKKDSVLIYITYPSFSYAYVCKFR